MEDHRNPYAQPAASVAAASGAKFRLSNFLPAFGAAFVGIVVLFFAAERQYFSDQTNDPALLRAALPQLLSVALVSGLACSFTRHSSWVRAVVAGLLLGPTFAFLAFLIYQYVNRWS